MIAILAVALAGHTFKSCSLPKFEWAVYGKYTTARWYGMTAAVTGNCTDCRSNPPPPGTQRSADRLIPFRLVLCQTSLPAD